MGFYTILFVVLIVEFLFYTVKYFREGSLSRTLYTLLIVFMVGFSTFLSMTQHYNFPAPTSFYIVNLVSFCILIHHFLLLSDNLIVVSTAIYKMKFVQLATYLFCFSLFFYFNLSSEVLKFSNIYYRNIREAFILSSEVFNPLSLLLFPLMQISASIATLVFSIKFNASKKQPVIVYFILFTTSLMELAFFLLPNWLKQSEVVQTCSNIMVGFLITLTALYLPCLSYQPSSGRLFTKNSIHLWKNSTDKKERNKITQLISIYIKRYKIFKIELLWYEMSILKNFNKVLLLQKELKKLKK